MNVRKAIIVGASTGIGYALAKELGRRGFALGLASRRVDLLEKLNAELPQPARLQGLDVMDVDSARAGLETLIAAMDGVDLIILNAGVGPHNRPLDWPPEKITIDTNVTGFAALAGVAMHHFAQRGKGHLVGLSSVAALRGSSLLPAYNASKAFCSSYLEGLRNNARQRGLDIAVTDVRPGFVDTPMTRGLARMFWVARAEKAATQIARAIEKKRKVIYVTRRWGLVALVMRFLPDWIYWRLGA